MQSVHIGIGRKDDLPVAQLVEAFLYPQRPNHVIEFRIVDNRVAVGVGHVLHLAAQRVDRLIASIPRTTHCAARRIALGKEYHRVLSPALAIALHVEAQMLTAVLQLLDVQSGGG